MRVVWLLVAMASLACVASLSLEERQKTLSENPDKSNVVMRVEREAKKVNSEQRKTKEKINNRKKKAKKAGRNTDKPKNSKKGSKKQKRTRKEKKQPKKADTKRKNQGGKKTAPKKKKIMKKAQKGSRKQKKIGQRVQKKVQRQGQCDDCLTTAQEVLLFEGYNVKNFIKQYTRNTGMAKMLTNKLEKKAQFEPSATKLKSAVSDVTNISCSNATFFKAVWTRLNNCTTYVAAACDKNMSAKAVTDVDECFTLMDAVKPLVEACMKLDTAAAACSCWTDVSTNNMTPIKDKKCNNKMTAMVKAQVDNRNVCRDTFSDCKQLEDAAPMLVYNCMDVGDTSKWNNAKDIIG